MQILGAVNRTDAGRRVDIKTEPTALKLHTHNYSKHFFSLSAAIQPHSHVDYTSGISFLKAS